MRRGRQPVRGCATINRLTHPPTASTTQLFAAQITLT